MSKFYTFEGLRNNPPSKEAVSKTRDRILDYLKDEKATFAVVYGSSIWGAHKKFSDQHTRRSDVDVALSAWTHSFGYAEKHKLADFCGDLKQSIHAPIEIINVGMSDGCYSSNFTINPSTADHFRLLAKIFGDPYIGFKKSMDVGFRERLEDFEEYVGYMGGWYNKFFEEQHAISKKTGIVRDWSDAGSLDILSKLENFPDHVIRKVLGREKMLPCPDSKENVRRVFRSFPYRWKVRDGLLPSFEEVFGSSQMYEVLVDDVVNGRISETEYYTQLAKIGDKILGVCRHALDFLGRGLSCNLEITRIPAGTPVIILHHHTDSDGGFARVAKLEEPFGNTKTGVYYPSGYATKPIYGTEPDDPLIKRWEKTDILVHVSETNLDWIKDPTGPEGWFTYKRGTDVFSIKPCSEDFFNKVESETDVIDVNNSDEANRKFRINQRYYREFVGEALNPALSFVPINLKNRGNRKKKVVSNLA